MIEEIGKEVAEWLDELSLFGAFLLGVISWFISSAVVGAISASFTLPSHRSRLKRIEERLHKLDGEWE